MRPTLRQLSNTPQRRAPVTILVSPRRAVAPYAGRHALGSLGITANTSMVGAGAAAGTAVLPGIGTVVGAVLGLVAGSLLNKQYLNVPQANAGEDNAVAAFNQYRTIAGQVPGRQFGVDAMNAIWDGAVYSGLFPLNNARQCFHEGCLKYPGQPDWVWGTFHDGANNRFTFAYAYQQWRAARQSQPLAPPQMVAPPPYIAAGVVSTTNLPGPLTGGQSTSVAPMMGVSAPAEPINTALAMRPAGGAILRMAGFGALGDPGNLPYGGALPDAVAFIDQFFIPNSQADSPPWAVPSTPLEHQILYDAADAWLANQPVNTIPYVAAQYTGTSVQTPPVVMPAASTVNPCNVPYVPGAPQLNVYCGPGINTSAQPGSGGNFLAPVATPQLPPTPIAIAAGGGAVTSVTAATSANLDAAMQSQGFTRVGTSVQGFPLYSQAGQVYAYQNGQLYPAGSVAQLAMTGGAGTGISVPSAGVDPNILATITAAIQSGMSQAQAANAGAQQLAAQGVPITPDVQNQLQTAAAQPIISGGLSSNTVLLGIAAVVGLFLITGRGSRAAA